MVIEIKGVQFVNKGAELMLYAVLQQLAKIAPEADIVLRPNKGSPYCKRSKLGAYQKLTLTKNILDLNRVTYYLPKKVRAWLKSKWGVITEADIDIILDASGFAYGDQWSSVALRQLSKELNRFDQKNKKYIFLPQALGPFTRTSDQKFLQNSLPKASMIAAREKSSFEHIQRFGINGDVLKCYADFTNLVIGKCPDYFQHSEPVFILIPNSKMLSDKNSDTAWRNRYIDVFVSAINLTRKMGIKPILLNHEGVSDLRVCERIQSELTSSVEFIHEENPIHVKGIIGKSRLVLCSRFHGCVSALSQGVPCIGTSWSYKYERLFEEYDRARFLLRSPPSPQQLEQLMLEGINEQYSNNEPIILAMKNQSKEMWHEVSKHLV